MEPGQGYVVGLFGARFDATVCGVADTGDLLVLDTEDSLAVAAVEAIHAGDVAALRRLLAEQPRLATARLGDYDGRPDGGMSRTLLHVVTDWPGHYPNGAATVALLDAGADIDACGAVIGGGTPLDDARAFAQWRAAHRLVERGARTTLQDAATLGLADRVERYFADPTRREPDEVSRALWGACHGGQHQCAAYLLDRGADINWIPGWENLTPLGGATGLAAWLRGRGAMTAAELHR
jgi:hypothetical protein